jgi:plasmid replication initiation protein
LKLGKDKLKSQSKQLIVKHNNIIEARYKLNLIEIKLVAKLASSIKNGDTNLNIQKYKVSDLLKEFGSGEKNHHEIKKATLSLIGKVMVIKKPDGELHIAFLSSAEYYDKKGIVELEFSEKLKPYYLQLKQNFTSYHLENILKLKSYYSIRIYELVKQFQNSNTKERILENDELREILGISGKYKVFRDLKNWVLLPAQKEIIEKTDITFQFEPIRECRKITKVRFFNIRSNNKQTNRLEIKFPKVMKDKTDINSTDITTALFKAGIRPKSKVIKLVTDYPDNYLKQHLENLQAQLKNNKVNKEKSGGWLYKAITAMTHGEVVEKEKALQTQERQEREHKKIKREQEKAKKIKLESIRKYDVYCKEQSEKYLNDLPQYEIERIEKLFLEHLKAENEIYLFNRCRKKGVINCKNDFLPWITEKYLTGQIMSFDDFKN